MEVDAIGGQGGVEVDPMRQCRHGGMWSRSGCASGREMIVARVRVRAPHT
jgi:hypothetical protein